MKRLKGIFLDSQPIDQPERTYRNAKHIEINRSLGAIMSERGTKMIGSLSGIIIGELLLSDYLLLFVKENGLKLYSFDGTDTPQLLKHFESLPIGDYVQAVFNVTDVGETIIYFVDGENEPRYLNLNQLNSFNNENLSLTPLLNSLPNIDVKIQHTGGELQKGVYYFALAYVDNDGNYTNYFDVKGPYIINDFNKSIRLQFTNLDTEYKSLRIAVVPKIENIIGELQQISDIQIPQSGNVSFTYSGNNTFSPSSLTDVIVDKKSFKKASTIATQDNTLFLGNIEYKTDIDYQEFADNIVVKGVKKTLTNAKGVSRGLDVDMPNSYVNPEIASTMRHFRTDEVYAFYIALIMKDGSLSKAFHIPGREAAVIQPQQGTGSIDINTDYILSDRNTVFTLSFNELFFNQFVESAQPDVEYKFKLRFNGSVDTAFIQFDPSITSFDAFQQHVIDAIDVLSGVTYDYITEQFSVNSNVIPLPLLEIEMVQVGIEPIGNVINRPISFLRNVLSYQILDTGLDSSTFTGNLQLIFDDNPLVLGTNAIQVSVTSNTTALSLRNAIITQMATLSSIVTTNTVGTIIGFTTVNNTSDYNGYPKVIFNKADGYPELNYTLTPISKGTNVPFSELDDVNGISYYKQFSKNNDNTGLGYWENTNEVYGSESSFSGQKVRHHKFLDAVEQPFVNGNDFIINGIKLENVFIPDSIKEQAIGFKVFYAKRTPENKTIVDSGVSHKSRLQDNILRSIDFNDGNIIDDPNIRYFHPFYSLATRQPLSNVSAVKKTHNLVPEISNLILKDNHIIRVNRLKQGGSSNEINLVEGLSYVESMMEEVYSSLNVANIDKTILNNRSESKVVIKTENPWDNGYYLCDFITLPEDIYDSYNDQLLVDTGYTHLFDNNDTYTTDEIYGGDTFINCYTYKTASKPDGSDKYYVTVNSVVTQSDANIAYRSFGDLPWQSFYPKNQSIENTAAMRYKNGKFEFRYDSPPDTEGLTYDNYIQYDQSYSSLADIKPAFPIKPDTIIHDFPSRIHRSTTVSKSLRTFLQNDYLDLTRNKGKIIKLSVYNNILIPHLERTLVRTRGQEELQTGDIRAFIGSGDIFAARPEELIYTEEGFGGIQDFKHSVSTPFGYYFIDKQVGKVYQLNNDGVAEISNNGLRNYFENGLSGNVGIYYDPKLRRIVVTTNNRSISYYPEYQAWISFHDYSPYRFIRNFNKFYSHVDGVIYEHNVDGEFNIYNNPVETLYEFVDNQIPELSKIVDSITLIGEVVDRHNNPTDDIIDTIQLRNSSQVSNELNVDTTNNFTYIGTTRKSKNEWNFNKFREQVANVNEYNWAYAKRIQDKYVTVTMKFYPSNNRLYIYDVIVNFKPAIR